jgi:hypothetical protein
LIPRYAHIAVRLPRLTPALAAWIALLAYACLNAILYSGLLPLWDGFDEPLHYGYVQWLRCTSSLPILGRTPVPDEIVKSLDLVPTSYAVQRNLNRGIPFDIYFTLSKEQRIDLRDRLEKLDHGGSPAIPQMLNYEAHQAPLAYAVLVPFDALWAHLPLTGRILLLRLLISLTSVLLLWWAMLQLATLTRLPPRYSLAAAFVTFSSQMLYATVCHVANDWLAVPVWALFVCAAVDLHLHPKTTTAMRLSLWLAVGLLTKAYFLIAVPFALVLLASCCVRRKLPWPRAAALAGGSLAVAAPWYLRNLVLYRNLAGMQETNGGIPLAQLAGAALHVPWLRALMATARTSLWTGNNSLFTFSSKTIGIMLLLLAAAGIAYAVHAVRDRLPEPERPLLAALLCFAAGLAYSTVLTFWYTHGAGISPAPWYVQALLAPGLCLLFIGLSSFRLLGTVLALAIVWLWTYVLAATYVAKLIPFYAGFNTGRAHLADLTEWWRRLVGGSWGTLDTAALLPPGALIVMTSAVVIVAVTLAAALSVALVTSRKYTS